jgi:hypothetical protein
MTFLNAVYRSSFTGHAYIAVSYLIHSLLFLLLHLQHRQSVKRFVSLSYRQSVGPLGRGISLSKGRYVHRTTQTQNKRRKNIHASNGIRTNDPSVREGEDFCIISSELEIFQTWYTCTRTFHWLQSHKEYNKQWTGQCNLKDGIQEQNNK